VSRRHAEEAAQLIFMKVKSGGVRLGKNIGCETDGKSREFTRPIIILEKCNQYSFLALPLTTALPNWWPPIRTGCPRPEANPAGTTRGGYSEANHRGLSARADLRLLADFGQSTSEQEA